MSSVPERPERPVFDSIVSWQTNHHGEGGDWIGYDAEGNAHHFAYRRDLSDAEKQRNWDDIARRDPEGAQRLNDAVIRLILSATRRLGDELTAEGFTAEHVRANPPRADEAPEAYIIRLRAAGAAQHTTEPEPPAPKPKRRAPRPKPSKLAKWEAAWQAEQAEDDSVS